MFTLLLILNLFLCSSGENLPPYDYAFEFPDLPHAAAPVLNNVPLPNDIRKFSFSIWVINTDARVYESTAIVSYAIGDPLPPLRFGPTPPGFAFRIYSNKFLFRFNNEYSKSIFGERNIKVNETIKVNEWVHYVVTIDTCADKDCSKGIAKVYINGEEEFTKKDFMFNEKKTFNGNGTIVLGQIQHKMGGDFDGQNTFPSGRMTSFNVWDKVLEADEVKQVYKLKLEGNIVAWSKAVWSTTGGIRIVDNEGVKEAACKENSPSNVSIKLRFYQQH